jgi:allantoinase
MADLYIKNAKIVTEHTIFNGGIVVEGDKVAEVVAGDLPVQADQVVDLGGKLLLPGLIDGHVHFNEPGREHWEGYTTGSMAAAAGGITTFLEMPLNAIPPSTSRAFLAQKREAVCDRSVVDFGNWGGLVDDNLSDLADLHADGVMAFKAFVSNSGVEYERLDDDLIYAGLLKMAELGNVLGLHAENEYVTRYLARQMKAAGRTDRASWYESRPPETELEAIQRAIFWARVTKGNLMIVHVSVAEGLRALAQAKQEGVRVIAETCPHYLFFDHQDFERIGPAAKCAPPIRSRENVEAMWQCVLAGIVDVIGSDHSPCNWEEKAKGVENIWKAWGGISGVQTLSAVLLSEGVNKRGLSLPAMVRMTSANPARLYGLYPQKGALLPGSDADMTVVDLEKEWTLSTEDLLYKNKHSAYVGYSFKGKVEQTYVRGKLVYKDGKIVSQPGYGRLLRRQYPFAAQR